MRFLRLLGSIACAAAPVCAQQITSMKGNVSVRSVDSAPWTPAAAGMSLAGGAMISTGPNANVEVRVDASDSFTAGPNSQCKLVALYGGQYQLEFTAGNLTYQSAGPSTSPLQVNLPAVAVQPVQPGIYSFSQPPNGQSQISVQAGLARVIAPAGSELVNAGQKMQVRDSGNGAEFKVTSAISKWRRFVMVANVFMQASGAVANAFGGESGNSQKSLAPGAKSATTASQSVDTRARTDPPANSAPPPAIAAAGRGK